mmetsp:Transcript_69420/g.224501  ORF Transcript_69420/g.224501 Transcript_69420/m.224501 type:complete len:212 (-) Transcript_69420:293-928(-)
MPAVSGSSLTPSVALWWQHCRRSNRQSRPCGRPLRSGSRCMARCGCCSTGSPRWRPTRPPRASSTRRWRRGAGAGSAGSVTSRAASRRRSSGAPRWSGGAGRWRSGSRRRSASGRRRRGGPRKPSIGPRATRSARGCWSSSCSSGRRRRCRSSRLATRRRTSSARTSSRQRCWSSERSRKASRRCTPSCGEARGPRPSSRTSRRPCAGWSA